MLLGVVSNPPRERSEKTAWRRVVKLCDWIESFPVRIGGFYPVALMDEVRAVKNLALDMVEQVSRGVHVNPGGHAGGKMSDDVLAVVYVHRKDGKLYVHGFDGRGGDGAAITLRTKAGTRGEVLSIGGLARKSGVQMFAEPDGGVRMASRDGHVLWEDR